MLRKIKIDRKIYESRKTKEKINDNFTEFIIKKYTIDEFFDLYQQLFYEIEKIGRLSHTTIIAKSTEYAGAPPNPKDQEILDLRKQVKNLQYEIDSIPEEHPFLPNDLTVIQSRQEPSLRYLMQSGRRRRIMSDNVFDLLKSRTGYSKSTPNEDFSVLLNADAIAGITPGPDINTQEGISIEIAEVNRFTPGVDPNDPLSIKIKYEKPDLRVNPALPEMNNYNPMANIEEPTPTPEQLELKPIMNTNFFNQSNVPLSNYRYKANS